MSASPHSAIHNQVYAYQQLFSVAVSMGRRNTHTKPRHSGFGPEGLTRLSKGLGQQLIPVNERVALDIGSRPEPLFEQAIRVVVGTRLPVFQQIGIGVPVKPWLLL